MPYVDSRLGKESDPALSAKNLPSAASENEPRQFPSFHRVKPLEPFRERWNAKRQDYDQFVARVEEVNSTNLRTLDARLPDGLVDDWQASWVCDLFRGILPGHDRLTQEQIASAFEDVEALVEAFQFVEYPGRFNNTCRFWLYELSDNPGMGLFPRLDQVVSHLPDLNPRRGMEHLAGDASNSSRYDQGQFFEAAAFLLGTPTDLEWDWLHRLAYRPCPLDSIWSDPPRHRTWTRNQLVRVMPELDDSTLSITEVVRRTDKLIRRNWTPTFRTEEDQVKGTP